MSKDFIDRRDGDTIGITNVTILTATSDHFDISSVVDAAFLHTSKTTADPTFYITSGNDQIAIDGATVGTEFVIVTRHQGMINYDTGAGGSPVP